MEGSCTWKLVWPLFPSEKHWVSYILRNNLTGLLGKFMTLKLQVCSTLNINLTFVKICKELAMEFLPLQLSSLTSTTSKLTLVKFLGLLNSHYFIYSTIKHLKKDYWLPLWEEQFAKVLTLLLKMDFQEKSFLDSSALTIKTITLFLTNLALHKEQQSVNSTSNLELQLPVLGTLQHIQGHNHVMFSLLFSYGKIL